MPHCSGRRDSWAAVETRPAPGRAVRPRSPQPLVGSAAKLVQHEIVRVSADQGVEILRVPRGIAQTGSSPARVVAGHIARRVGSQNLVEIIGGPLRVAKGEGNHPAQETRLVVLGRSLEHAVGECKGTRRVAPVLISLAQHPFDIRVIGLLSVEMIEIGDRLGQPPFREGQPAAVDEGLGIIGVGDEPAVHLGALGLSPRLGFEDFTDDPHGLGGGTAGGGSGRGCRDAGYDGASQSSPSRGELVANSPQIPQQYGLLPGRRRPASCRRG